MREMFNLVQAAQHVCMEANELRHFAQRGEIKAEKRADDWWFDHRELDEWAQRHLLETPGKRFGTLHNAIMNDMGREHRASWRVAGLFRPDAMSLDIKAKTKGGMIRDMADLAIACGLVYDDEGFYKELVAREEAASTAIGGGAAFLHPRYHDPYFFEDTFVAYGRSRRDVFFGAPEGEGTRHFFLVCSTDHENHLRILARLAMLAHGTDLMERLDAAETVEDAMQAIAECEEELCGE
ncbi:MAG: PTS sugar transporter subunit IIA [Kiritimatiellae bacterium]|nr:PTS sugar transporter subunit IIA [Kiritimatiellia bacterium]